MDPACQRVLPFQTMVSDFGYGEGIIKWRSLASRLKCNETVNDYWDDTEIDAFYKGAMPKWLFHVDAHNKKYYVVQESELLENDWLHLFAEIALYSKSNRNLDAPPLLEMKNVVIETKEEYTTEAREKLQADNAIFYISFKYNGDPSTGWGAGDHNAIIRKTMDGGLGHMSLEVARRTEEERLCSDYQSLYI
ncbi:hypothetical protein V5N11_006913 [Cardamine amara subsp. amara]|uniref:Uncharacterized protein n=1 Tax=Cardamine amara subsp. amara TaxID=228776 RepID=A0ABD1AV20_CARAN